MYVLYWNTRKTTGWIKVCQLAADKLMEDLTSAASLVKTLQFPGFYLSKLLCTELVLGCVMETEGNDELSVVLFEKTALDTANPPEQTLRNIIHLGATNYNCNYLVDMNTTSLVFVQNQRGTPEGQVHLCKKDFWMSGTTHFLD